jgi:hypothetical protein
MEKLIAKILTSEMFADEPPVFIDIGASGAPRREWKLLAPYAICVAFDGDVRDFTIEETTRSGWKRLIKLNRLVAEHSNPAVDFFLTKFPHCSSTLKPDTDALAPWAFAELFAVERTITMPAVSLGDALRDLALKRIDWFKTDSQGTDLRIFASLPSEVIDNVIVADFEPGILDAYKGEDKLHSVLAFMGGRPFFLCDMKVVGSHRIDKAGLASLTPLQRDFLDTSLKRSPGWTEISYLNDFASPARRSTRDLLLGWICSSVKEQYGHALAIAEKGLREGGHPFLAECRDESLRRLRGRARQLMVKAARRRVSRLLGRS